MPAASWPPVASRLEHQSGRRPMLSSLPFEAPPNIMRLARDANPVVTAVANAGARLPMESARIGADAGVMSPVLVGDRDAIEREADALDWDISTYRVVATSSEEEAATQAARLCGAGEAQALMKGHVHTDTFMLAILNREAGLRTDRRLTHVFHMTVPGSDKALLITDAAVNVAPDIKTKKAAIQNAVGLAHSVGIACPNVAVLSATEEVTDRMPSSVEAAELTEWASSEIQDAHVYGPLALDNAISPAAAAIKNIDHPVAGHADVLVVPDIVSGNVLFKMMVYMKSACAAGLVLGARVPVILTSRADPPEARLTSVAIAAILVNSSASS